MRRDILSAARSLAYAASPSRGLSTCTAAWAAPSLSLRPTTKKLRRFFASRRKTVSRGGLWRRHKQGWGYPVAPALVLEMHRLNVLREHTWQDMTCTVEAGCTWAAMQSGLAQHGQYVALDPLWPERATVGGIVATNDSGALRLRYGGLRDLIIGMTIVLADGTVARTGGKVVKNVAGYDLHKLMIGAFGTLGVITSVNFRLHAMPQCTQSFSVSAPAAEPLGKLMLKLLHAQLSTVAIQLAGHGDGIRSRYPTRVPRRGAAYTSGCAGGDGAKRRS